jgi:hypothetical protein
VTTLSKMSKNSLWLALMGCMAIAVLWFTFNTGYQLYRWVVQTAETVPTNIEWQVRQESQDRYTLAAQYAFKVNDSTYLGETIFRSKRYKSPETAAHFLQQNIQTDWKVFYAPDRPRISTINRIFPLKSCIYTAIVWGVIIYFFWLGRTIKNNA